MNSGRDGRRGPWTMEELHIAAGTAAMATGSVRLSHADGRTVDEAAVGDGPVEAAFKALERATGIDAGTEELRSPQRDRGRGCAG